MTLPPTDYVSMGLFEWAMGIVFVCFGSLLGMLLRVTGIKTTLLVHLEEDKKTFAELREQLSNEHRENREDLRLLRTDLSEGQTDIRRLLEAALMKQLEKR